MSQINDQKMYEKVVYALDIHIDLQQGIPCLNFEGVDYECDIYLNEKFLIHHQGGFTPFSVDLSEAAKTGHNRLVVIVKDSFSKSQLRGKQRSRSESYDCWYVQSTGIYKSVYLEYKGHTYLKDLRINTELTGLVHLDVEFNKPTEYEITITHQDNEVYRKNYVASKEKDFVSFTLDNIRLWDADNPHLYDIEIRTSDDKVNSYFFFREVKVKDDYVYINGKPVYLKMILDQGYWKDSGITSPHVNALVDDIKMVKLMGFNGIRKHQKFEDRRFYYLCDLLGVYVWGEIPSLYEFNGQMKNEFMKDSLELQHNLSKFASVITYVIFNESWGIPEIRTSLEQQEYVSKMYSLFKKNDPTRLVISNDGWHHVKSDILTIHDYEQDAVKLYEKYKNKDEVIKDDFIVNGFGPCYAANYKYDNEPIIISEFGGIASKNDNGWGYGQKADDKNDLIKRFKELIDAVSKLDYVTGYCYTQLSDVEQETNGLLDSNHHPKFDLDLIKQIVTGGNSYAEDPIFRSFSTTSN